MNIDTMSDGEKIGRGLTLRNYITLLESGEVTREFCKLLTSKQYDHFLHYRMTQPPSVALSMVVREGHL